MAESSAPSRLPATKLHNIEEDLSREIEALAKEIQSWPKTPAGSVYLAGLYQAQAVLIAKRADVQMERAIRGI